ncbi:hypothetical protein K8I85_19435 [bacterium]|nr:hypothetical protein [bacterium]
MTGRMICGMVGAIASCVLGGTPSSAFDIVPYESQGWRYLQVFPGDPLGDAFMAPGFDDSSWGIGQAAFGNLAQSCPLNSTVHTPWGGNLGLLLRRSFAASSNSPVTVYYAIDNVADIWVNGVLVSSASHSGCASLDDYSVGVPANVLNEGANLLAVRAIDTGYVSYFDARVEGTAPLAVDGTSWSAVKALYR